MDQSFTANERDFSDDTPSAPIFVVIADNQTVARKGTCLLLQNTSDIEVQATATTRAEALRLVDEHRPDVLVTEARLPDGLGTEIPSLLRDKHIATKVLIWSAFLREAYLKSFLEAGEAGYLLKQDETERLVEALRGLRTGEMGWYSRPVASRMLALRKNGPRTREGRSLTSRENELLAILADGLTNREIAEKLDLSVGTVKNYLTAIYEKLGVDGRARAIVWAHEHGAVV